MKIALLYVLDGRAPSLEYLANECLAVAKEPETRAWRRLWLWRTAARLRRAARWQQRMAQPFWRYLWHIGVVRYGAILGGTLGILALARSIADANREGTAEFANLAVLVLSGIAVGTAVAATGWFGRSEDVKWAEQYTAARVDLETKYRSPDGHNGMRLERDSDGEWTFRSDASTT